jgi:general transcription factor 3C polypeptide 4
MSGKASLRLHSDSSLPQRHPLSWARLLVRIQPFSGLISRPQGISYLPQHDALVVALIDGSYHVVHNASTSPSLQGEETISPCNSADMSRLARSAFLVAEEKEKAVPKDGSEPERLYRNHVARTWGALAIDSAGVFLWMHQ